MTCRIHNARIQIECAAAAARRTSDLPHVLNVHHRLFTYIVLHKQFYYLFVIQSIDDASNIVKSPLILYVVDYL